MCIDCWSGFVPIAREERIRMKGFALVVALVMFAAPALADDTIYDIQNGTIAEGTPVTVEGVIVTAADLEYSSSFFYVEEPGAGQYSGVKVYYPAGAGVARGDIVDITGVTLEYYDETEIDASAGTVTIVYSGAAPPAPELVYTGSFGEEYEGVLIFTCCTEVTNPDLGYGEWEIDDGTGPGVADDYGQITYVPALADERVLTGIQMYGYGTYRIVPRDDDDIETCCTAAEPASWAAIKCLF